MSALKSELCNAIVNGDALLEGVADVAFDAVIGRLARSDVDVANHTALRDAVQSTAAGASKTIRVTEDITWPSLGSAEYPNFTITVPAGANVTLFGAGGVFRRQKIKLSGPSNSTNQPQVRVCMCVCARARAPNCRTAKGEV